LVGALLRRFGLFLGVNKWTAETLVIIVGLGLLALMFGYTLYMFGPAGPVATTQATRATSTAGIFATATASAVAATGTPAPAPSSAVSSPTPNNVQTIVAVFGVGSAVVVSIISAFIGIKAGNAAGTKQTP
jgi:hypothetical protein